MSARAPCAFESPTRMFGGYVKTVVMAQFADWQLGDVFVTARGAKQCALTDGAGKVIRYKPEDVLTVPFGLSAWEEGATRKNLELRCTPAVEDYFERFDEWARA